MIFKHSVADIYQFITKKQNNHNFAAASCFIVFLINFYMMFIYQLTAIAIAMSDSVTVSIGDDTNGARNEIDLVNGDVRSTSSAVKSMNPGKIMKSLEK